VVVGEGEPVRFAPGDLQVGYDDPELGEEDENVVGFALGAPGSTHDWDELESIVRCRECGEETGHSTQLTGGVGFRLECNECGNSFEIGGD